MNNNASRSTCLHRGSRDRALLAGLGSAGSSYGLLRLNPAQPVARQESNGMACHVIVYVAGGGVGVEKSDPVVGTLCSWRSDEG